jgi:hypothetical protein
MTVKELITLLMLQDPDARVMLSDSGAPPEMWEDESAWSDVADVYVRDTNQWSGGQMYSIPGVVRLAVEYMEGWRDR